MGNEQPYHANRKILKVLKAAANIALQTQPTRHLLPNKNKSDSVVCSVALLPVLANP